MATKKEIADRRANEQTFSGLFRDGAETPESIVSKIMWGQTTIMHLGKRRKISKTMQAAAMALLPYRLPRLNSVDAQVQQVDMTHEEWLEQMDDGAPE